MRGQCETKNESYKCYGGPRVEEWMILHESTPNIEMVDGLRECVEFACKRKKSRSDATLKKIQIPVPPYAWETK